ncbi:MAG TPA: cell division protein FtsZ [Vicinamibacterales bacterium]
MNDEKHMAPDGQGADLRAVIEPLRLKLETERREGARIKVIGVGGGGGNAVNRMVRTGLEGVEFIVANTDLQALANNAAPTRIQIGGKLTKGLGAGADPDIGRRAALEDTDKLIEVLSDADMVFVTTGLGGGTGTGAAPVIAGLASELGALTIAVVTKPFKFEGKRRALQAERGLSELRDAVDTVITIPNERLLATIDRRTPLPEAFCAADDVLRQAIQGISDLILVPGMINLDFADVKTIMSGMGFAIMGTGTGEGETRAVDAANRAISSPLLEDASVSGARGVILNITGGPDFSLAEVNDAATIIQEAAHEDANIIFGAVIDPTMEGKVKITVIATGFDRPDAKIAAPPSQTPVDLQHYTAWRQEERAVAGGGGAGRIAITRRPIVELPPVGVTLGPPSERAEDGSGEGGSPLDVPAFLRRQEG